jgi:acyl-CoA thioester hydrolase
MDEKVTDFNYKIAIDIRFPDIDALGHVNNAVYLTYFEHARVHYWRDILQWKLRENGIIVARTEVNYLKPVTLEDEIACYVRTTRIGNSSFDITHLLVKITPAGEEICTMGKTVCISYDYTLNRPVPLPEKERQKIIAYDNPKMIMNTN